MTSHEVPPESVDPAATPADPVSPWNIANALTGLRLVLVPVFVWLLMHDGGHETWWRVAAFGAFVVASATDRLDGELARRHGMVTDLGKLADPIADKALTGGALVGLSLLGDLPWWVTVVIVVRELAVTGLRFVVIRHGVIAASRGGKLKTVLQGVAIGLFILPLSGPAVVLAWVVMVLAVAVTVVTGLDYLLRALRLRQTSERAALKRERAAIAREGRDGDSTGG